MQPIKKTTTRGRPGKVVGDIAQDLAFLVAKNKDKKYTVKDLYEDAVHLWKNRIQADLTKKVPTISNDALQAAYKKEIPSYDAANDYYNKHFHPELEKLKTHPLNKPWSLLGSIQFGIPAEVTEDLYDLWRLSMIIDHEFTIREARWVPHIRRLGSMPLLDQQGRDSGKVRRLQRLLRLSRVFSIHEMAGELVGSGIEPSKINGVFLFPVEWAVAAATGKVNTEPFLVDLVSGIDQAGLSPEQFYPSMELIVWNRIKYLGCENQDQIERVDTEPLKQNEEDDFISALMLSFLGKGPNWPMLPIETKRHIRDEVHSQVSQDIKRGELNSRAFDLRDELFDQVYDVTALKSSGMHVAVTPRLYLFGKEMLGLVGYEQSEKSIEKEGDNNRTLSPRKEKQMADSNQL